MTLQSPPRAKRDIPVADAAWHNVADAQDDAFDLPEIQPTINWSACGRGLLCACGAAGASHIGCIVAPAVAFAGVAGSTSIATLSMGASLALTAAGAGLWYGLRGRIATRLEKTLTITGMAAGAAMTLGLHFGGAVGGHDHHHNMEEALEWYRAKPEAVQLEIRQSAAALKRPLQDYIFEICGTEADSTPSAPAKKPGLGLDKS